jgi:hypothetical protein
MTQFHARSLMFVCVTCVTATFAGCYKPAAGKLPEPPKTSPPAASISPAVASSPEPAPAATPSATASTQLASAVDAALRNPLPVPKVDTRFQRPPPEGAAPQQPVASRSPSRSPRTKVLSAPETAGGVQGITFDSLVFPLEKDQPFVESLLTQAVRDLFGRKVKIRGYIHPSCPFQTGVTSFILVRDDQSCCFGPGAALYDCIIVDMVPGRTTNFTPKPVAVAGTLQFKEFKDLDGKHLAIFHLDADTVE